MTNDPGRLILFFNEWLSGPSSHEKLATLTDVCRDATFPEAAIGTEMLRAPVILYS